MTKDATLDAFPLIAEEKLRYGDTDRQGHVNNAVFATFFETGRVELLLMPEISLADAGAAFVIARLEVDFEAEVRWPGIVKIGTAVARVGSSSVRLTQAAFQDGRRCARAASVIVQVDAGTGRPAPLSAAARAKLTELLRPELAAPE